MIDRPGRAAAALAPLLLLFLVLPPLLDGQETGVLRIRTEGPRGVVEGATIHVLEGGRNIRDLVTDSDGSVVVRLVPATYRLRAERVGYAAAEAVVVLEGGAETTVRLHMREQAIEGEEIVVRSTRGERRIQDEPLRVEVVTREEIEEKLLMTPGNIAMLLNESTGLRVQETSPSLGGANVRVQGLRGRYTQILADGLPLYGGQAGSLGLLQIPPMDLEQLEVIKGAASALYGQSALGGVINLVSRRPEGDGELLLNATSRGGVDALLWHSEPWGEGEGAAWGHTLLAGAHAQERIDVDADGWAEAPRHRRFSARPRVFREGADGGELVLTAGAMVEDRAGGGTVPGGAALARSLETRRVDAAAIGRSLRFEPFVVGWRGSAVRTTHEHGYGERLERDAHSTAFLEGTFAGRSGLHDWVVGAALQRDAFRGRDVTGFDGTVTTGSLFAQDEIGPVGWATVALSARLDASDEHGTFVSPRGSLLVRPHERWTLRLSAGGGSFAPTPFLEEVEEVGLARLLPLASVRPERARTYSADVGVRAGPLEVNATLFASRVADAVAVRVAPSGDGPAALELFNLPGPTRTAGSELLLRLRREPFSVTASHTFLRSREPDPGADGGAGDDDGRLRAPVPLTPTHAGGLVAMWEEHDEGRVGVELYYTGRQPLHDNPYRETGKPYLILGVLLERAFGPLSLFLNLENLTNVRQSDHHPLLRPEPTSAGRWTTESWAPLEGRVVNGGIRYRFR